MWNGVSIKRYSPLSVVLVKAVEIAGDSMALKAYNREIETARMRKICTRY